MGIFTLFTVASASAQLNYVESSTGLTSPTMEAGQTELEFGDLNHDGHVDLAMIGDHGSPFIGSQQHGITVWLGDGAGNWSAVQRGDFGYGGIALGDINGDGWLDVGYGMHHGYSDDDFGNQVVEAALGDGTAQYWTPWDDGLAAGGGDWWGMFGTDFADIDHDGDLDLGTISFGAGDGLHIYANNLDGTWTEIYGFTGGNSNLLFTFGDINGDGHADFAGGHGTGTVWLGDGTGSFVQGDGNLPASSFGLRGTDLGDVDGDGRDDLAFINSSSGLDVWRWVAPDVWEEISGNLPASGSYDAACLADMNLDGRDDLVAFAYGDPSGTIRIFSRAADGDTWTQIAAITTPEACDWSTLQAGGDVDHNGYPDLVIVQEEDCSFFVGGRNRPRFWREASVPTGSWIHPVRPRAAEVWRAGSVRFIDWTTAVADAEPATVSLALSLAGPAGPWIDVATGVLNNGRRQWVVPADLPGSTTCHVRYRLTGAADPALSAGFTIVGAVPLGDADEDGSVDIADLATVADCLTGPDAGPATCPAVDADRDDDTDLHDLFAWQRQYGS